MPMAAATIKRSFLFLATGAGGISAMGVVTGVNLISGSGAFSGLGEASGLGAGAGVGGAGASVSTSRGGATAEFLVGGGAGDSTRSAAMGADGPATAVGSDIVISRREAMGTICAGLGALGGQAREVRRWWPRQQAQPVRFSRYSGESPDRPSGMETPAGCSHPTFRFRG